VIIIAFILEVALRGRQRELSSVLIFFRLIRFAAEGVVNFKLNFIYVLTARLAAVGVGELEEETAKELEAVKRLLEERTRALEEAQQKIQALQATAPTDTS
jgi:hypothetical protein